jgi:hypothetical protein
MIRSQMPSRFWIIAVVALAIVVALGSVVLQAFVLNQSFAIDASTRALLLGELAAVGSVASILEAFNRWLWRVWPFRSIPWPGKPPVLRGTWKMTLTIIRPTPHQAGSYSKTGYLILDQTASRIKVTTHFTDGDSRSTQAILEEKDGIWILNFFYRFFFKGDEYYWGAARLSVTPALLDGTYWNEEGGEGTWKSTARVPALHTSREDAIKALKPSTPKAVVTRNG